MASKIAIIITSTRTPRVGPHIATLVHNILKASPAASSSTFSIVDVDTFKLPIFNEPVVPANVPARGSFIHDHSKKWSAEIASHDAYVLIAPEYNYGIAGSTKNAIDYLKNEWDGKPAAIVTYGMQGGKMASDQIKQTLEGMGLRVSATRPQLSFLGVLAPMPLPLWARESWETLPRRSGRRRTARRLSSLSRRFWKPLPTRSRRRSKSLDLLRMYIHLE